MYTVIDTPWNTTSYLPQLIAGGVQTVIRYYNHENSSALPEKQLDETEAQAIAAAGLSIAVILEQTGGANGQIDTLDAANGESDAARALQLAASISQPSGSAIYFSVDHDYDASDDLQVIESYFEAIGKAFSGQYRVGVYGSGTVCKTLQSAGFVDLAWLAGSTGWSGTSTMLQTDQWALFQAAMDLADPLPHDGNQVPSENADFGQFNLDGPEGRTGGEGNVPMV